jgi:hypothetical protein
MGGITLKFLNGLVEGNLVQPPPIELFHGNASTPNGAATKFPFGGTYFDPTRYKFLNGLSAKFVLKALLQTTQTGNAAFLDIYDQNGITNGGTPAALSGSQVSWSSTTTPSVVSVELAPLKSFASLNAGVLIPRLWLQTPGGGQDAIVYGVWIEPSFS